MVLSTQHAPRIDLANMLTPDIREHVVEPVLADLDLDTEGFRLLVNPTGIFEIGGPQGDAGLTGRRSSSTPTAVWPGTAVAPSRAKTRPRWTGQPHTPCAGWPRTSSPQALAKRCEVQVAYAIGVAHPVGLFVQTFGTGTVPDAQIQEAITRVFDLRPAAIVAELDLLRPIFAQTAAYGHFGRELPEFTWESTHRADALAATVQG